MPLVEYSDSENSGSSDNEKPKVQGIKRKRTAETQSSLPPLPDTFHDLYASATRVSNQDDPDLHGGCQRITPHVEGNWPTHVYIEWHPSTEHSSRLDKFLTSISEGCSSVEGDVHSLLKSDLGAELPLHVSLSRPIALLGPQREPFVDALTNGIRKSNTHPFKVSVHAVDWVANYEQTRWFLIMKLEKPAGNELNTLLRISNQAAQSFGQPPLYAAPQAPPSPTHAKRRKGQKRPSDQVASAIPNGDLSSSFHVSIGWTLSAPAQALIDRVNKHSHDLHAMEVDVQAIKLKIGNLVSSVPLESEIDSSNGILER